MIDEALDYYIYYRVGREHQCALHHQVTQMQQTIAARLSIAVALKRRPDENQGVQTWMEIYLGVAPQQQAEFTRLLAEILASSGLGSLIQGPRQLECFMQCAPCQTAPACTDG